MSEALWDESPPAKKTRQAGRLSRAVDPPALKAPVNFHARTVVAPTPEPEPVVTFESRGEVRDYAYEDAIRALSSILHPDELPQFENILNPLSDVDLKTQVENWRARNGMA